MCNQFEFHLFHHTMHTNKLIKETSPYLLQHAHNPVDWYPWGEEALQRAKTEHKPILVSIGYAACHWCHVMEKESFEDEATAKIMNQYFINIKIDREERPDLDHIYMDAVQAMTGGGGWPLNVFLTPEGKPFFGGTYFPPIEAHNRKSWKDILFSVNKAFHEKKEQVDQQANSLTEHIRSSGHFGINSETSVIPDWSEADLQMITYNILQQGDQEWGGFGKAPKFPQTFSILYLFRQYHFDKDRKALDQALLSLDKMIQGGIYDQLGGGFARYSTDNKWLAPHFEKMLYDNALLISVLSEAYQLTGFEKYAVKIEECYGFITRELMSTEMAFYSALDADSEGVEGKFYTWSKQEITQLIPDDASWFCELYDIREEGNWEETNILWLKQPAEQFAAENGIEPKVFESRLKKCQDILMLARSQRIRPQTDDKVLLGWNSLMNIALSQAFAATGKEKYRALAIQNMSFLETSMREGTDWKHTYKEGRAKIPAFLDDYAGLIKAMILLQEITGNSSYLEKAKLLTAYVCNNFQEPETGYFYYTHTEQQDIIVRKKEVYDGATASGNAMMAYNLLYLAQVYDLQEWRQQAEKMVSGLKDVVIKYPNSFAVWADVLQLITRGFTETVIAGDDALAQLTEVLKTYRANGILLAITTERSDLPLLRNKYKSGKTVFYSCRNSVCTEPVEGIEKFLQFCNS